ncbi:MAG: hypothetical protein JWP87_5486 [Labilithrix sp.]|nr:hypothetical protein [Labilithrix sp.]
MERTTNHVVRRPAIRPRAVTPPRTEASVVTRRPLPPVRLPAPRITKRPVLALVDESQSPDSQPIVHAPPQPQLAQPAGSSLGLRTIAILAASIVAVASVTFVGLRASRGASTAITSTTTRAVRVQPIVSQTTTTSATLPAAARTHGDEPFVPIVDVKSLPAVRRRAASPHVHPAPAAGSALPPLPEVLDHQASRTAPEPVAASDETP